MNQLENSSPVKLDKSEGCYQIKSCCLETIKELIENNPMMVCQRCENLIKCFIEDSSYDKYVRFCQSRKRKIKEASYKNYKIVIFRKH